MALETKPLTLNDRWCAHAVCPYIGKPYDRDGKSICIKCKTERLKEAGHEG